MDLLTSLTVLRDRGPTDPLDGICSNLPFQRGDELAQMMDRWPERSKNRMYPVPHPHRAPMDAYHLSGEQEMWSPDHPYGAARLRLLGWLIEQLQSE